ncbi:TrkA family potassium uptake protein [Erysipelothrix amsterdamensis]|uniref:TrkA family potassium uptake protein n=1 Tax=Erysipelothrix amsterdamensis TaxID=2929157 RepID=A0AAU9VJ15_9FIRM|nr:MULTISPECIES: TrkA family potassium uptake protein [Erysipelothrix]CAH2761415.1 TrkA family potassium uptake protein [Erysipelothrix sp. A18Y020d]AYV35039.1 TrkA family potassium uptake protein [Erysipelothrix rhusiopathiae]MDE8081913.1 TrkA family potassium uptake protein [Erysipelothrix rhusiopathiae]MDE8256276.1 TrkA family potassium uptake protein [Erysipelothrix rhusiopathiae]MDE8262290.1 TrkA family potassium uptake protein [Erysipelothrix rhusiopathiae]
MTNKTVAILGLGLFGASIAKTLARHKVDVIAMDSKMERVEEVANLVEHAVQADFTKLEQLEAADVANADIAIIASGERLESTILGVLNLKKLGCKHVIVKTKNMDYYEVLKKVGADRVVLPEVEMGKRLANEIAKHSVIDALRIDDRYNIVEIHALSSWYGKSINDLNLRQEYGFNILGMKCDNNQEFQILVSPEYKVREGDLFFVLVEEKDLQRFNDLEDHNE